VWGVVGLGAAGVWVVNLGGLIYLSVCFGLQHHFRSYGYQTTRLSLHLFSNFVCVCNKTRT
jgi:hypothetical protein